MSTKSTMDNNGLAHKVLYRFDLLPMRAIMAAAEVMAKGAEDHPKNGWMKMSVGDLINHALGHIIQFLIGDRGEDHIAHAICRVAMAWEVYNNKRDKFISDCQEEIDHYKTIKDTLGSVFPASVPPPPKMDMDALVRPSMFPLLSAKVVYLCYPYSDDPERRTRIISEVAREIRDKYPNKFMLIPHLLFQYMDEKTQREKIMQMCLNAIDLCDTLLVVGDFVSDGMMMEVSRATELGKVISDYSDAEARKRVEVMEHNELSKMVKQKTQE